MNKQEKEVLSDFRSVRPSVYQYAKRMEKRLREKDATRGKDGWHDGRFYYYLHEARKCYNKMIFMLLLRNIDKIKEKEIHYVIKKCVDGGNFFMMLADNLRDELVKRGVK